VLVGIAVGVDPAQEFDSPLGHHPDRVVAPGVELSSGSLGHGLPIAAGVAWTGRRVYCLVGDAELEEGSNWEAVQFAGRERLGSLTAVVVDNRSSTHGWPGGIGSRFEAEGWTSATADGRDHDELERALTAGAPDRPHAVVAVVTR